MQGLDLGQADSEVRAFAQLRVYHAFSCHLFVNACVGQPLLSLCQCSHLGPFTEDVPSCLTSLDSMDCRNEVTRFLTSSTASGNAAVSQLEASCPERCDEVEFRTIVSMGQFPSANALPVRCVPWQWAARGCAGTQCLTCCTGVW